VAAVAGGGDRGALLLRRGRRNAGQRATVQASTGREEFRMVGRHGVKTAGKFTGRSSMAGGSAMARARGAGGA
jgi:hypothetical protein